MFFCFIFENVFLLFFLFLFLVFHTFREHLFVFIDIFNLCVYLVFVFQLLQLLRIHFRPRVPLLLQFLNFLQLLVKVSDFLVQRVDKRVANVHR